MDITIANMEAYLAHRYDGWAKEQGLFMKMVEEMGEVAEVLNMRSGAKSEDGTDLQTQLGIELADVIHYAVAIAAINHIDLTETILIKDKKASLKYHHDINLETYISQHNQAETDSQN